MDAWIEIDIYGGQSLLATLKKQQTLPESSYTQEAVIEYIKLTPQVSTDVLLKITGVVYHENSNTLKTESNQLQVTKIISVLGKTNFISFLQQAELHGWQVSKFIDSINQYFYHVYQIHPLSLIEKLFKFSLQLLLIITLLLLPSLSLLVSKTQYTTNPFISFILFLLITFLTAFFYSILFKSVSKANTSI